MALMVSKLSFAVKDDLKASDMIQQCCHLLGTNSV